MSNEIKAPRTKDMLKQCLSKEWGQVYEVKVPSGFGEIIVQRCRVELSKIKNKLIERKIPFPRFKLRSDIIINSDHDFVRLWRQREEATGEMDIGELGEMLRETAEVRPSEMPKENSPTHSPAPFKLKIGSR